MSVGFGKMSTGGVNVGKATVGKAAVDAKRAAVFFVGNRLMRDDAIGPLAYDLFKLTFEVENTDCLDVGCMSLDMLNYVRDCDFLLTVDAVDETGQPAGTVFRFTPEDMARHCGAMASLHDLKLVDLFDAAMLLGYEAQGRCVGMQVLDKEPLEYDMELTDVCQQALPLLVETVAAELVRAGFPVKRIATGEVIAEI